MRMIQRITVEGFKSCRDVDLKLGSLNLFIGANATAHRSSREWAAKN